MHLAALEASSDNNLRASRRLSLETENSRDLALGNIIRLRVRVTTSTRPGLLVSILRKVMCYLLQGPYCYYLFYYYLCPSNTEKYVIGRLSLSLCCVQFALL